MSTGSLINNVMGAPTSNKPEVGMGATVLLWTDRRAVTVTRVLTPRKIEVQYDTAIRTDDNGVGDAQTYTYERNLDGRTEIYTQRKNGTWVLRLAPVKNGPRLRLGVRDEHYDYSF